MNKRETIHFSSLSSIFLIPRLRFTAFVINEIYSKLIIVSIYIMYVINIFIIIITRKNPYKAMQVEFYNKSLLTGKQKN